MPLWAALSASAAVFIGCGIFFAFQDLGTANDYATIASFFLALLTAAGSLLSFLRSKDGQDATTHGQGSRNRVHRSLVVLGNVKDSGIQIGHRNRMKVSIQRSNGGKKH